MHRSSSKRSNAKLKITPSRQAINEVYNQTNCILPPIASSIIVQNHAKKSNNQHSTFISASKFKASPTLIYGGNFTEYIKRPVYFCHPVITTKETSQKRTDHEVNNNSAKSIQQDVCQTIDNKKLNSGATIESCATFTNVPSMTNFTNVVPSVSIKFSDFCQKEGYNNACDTFLKSSCSFKKCKKFSKVSKPSTLRTLPEDADVDFCRNTKAITTQLTNKKANNNNNARKRSSIPPVKESARLSAVKGQYASAKALTFILGDPVTKKHTLPPLQQPPLCTFESPLNPDVSVVKAQTSKA